MELVDVVGEALGAHGGDANVAEHGLDLLARLAVKHPDAGVSSSLSLPDRLSRGTACPLCSDFYRESFFLSGSTTLAGACV